VALPATFEKDDQADLQVAVEAADFVVLSV
jgi:hypothetical protein